MGLQGPEWPCMPLHVHNRPIIPSMKSWTFIRSNGSKLCPSVGCKSKFSTQGFAHFKEVLPFPWSHNLYIQGHATSSKTKMLFMSFKVLHNWYLCSWKEDMSSPCICPEPTNCSILPWILSNLHHFGTFIF